MGLKLITPAATDPITLVEAKAQLRVTDNDSDTEIGNMVKAATRYAEMFLGRALIDQTWDLYLDKFPLAEIKIPLPPLIEVGSVNYFDGDGVEQTLDVANYYVDSASQPGWIVPQSNLQWPSTLSAVNSVRIRFRAGYLDNNSPPVANVPFDIKAAILLLLGAFYEHREETIVGSTSVRLPFSAETLLRNYRIEKSMA